MKTGIKVSKTALHRFVPGGAILLFNRARKKLIDEIAEVVCL